MFNKLNITAVFAAGLISLPAAALDRPDTWITAKTKVALALADDLPSTNINVDTFDGQVTLYGHVYSAEQLKRSEQVAHRIEGVDAVVNLLKVVPERTMEKAKRQDDKIEAEVRGRLKEDPALSRAEISIRKVMGGVVHLTGEVDSPLEHLLALRAANGVDGVRAVVSEIEEEQKADEIERWDIYGTPSEKQSEGMLSQTLTDIRVTSRVKAKLLADEKVSGLDVRVDTNDGVVALFGVVDGEAAKRAAEEHARTTPGAKQVDNYIQVVAAEAKPEVKRSDADVKRAVKALLSSRGFGQVDVAVKGGAVTLSGELLPMGQLRAATFARTVSGVKSVQQRFDTPKTDDYGREMEKEKAKEKKNGMTTE